MTAENGDNRHDFRHIRNRVKEKLTDHSQYDFSPLQNNLLKSFFDLAQEYDSLNDFYRIVVGVLLESMELDSALYLIDTEKKQLNLVCSSREGIIREERPVSPGIYLSDTFYRKENSYVFPIFRKQPRDVLRDETLLSHNQQPWQDGVPSLGVFEVYTASDLAEGDLFFLQKFVNRIGFQLHNRLVDQQNIAHLKFINNLVLDIEHNVIIPNMYFKHLFNQLSKKIGEMQELELEVADHVGSGEVNSEACLVFVQRLTTLRQDLMEYHEEMLKHHANLSLFLESLFRREHFERGHLVLRPKLCRVEKEIILPQLEQYKSRLAASNITIARPRGMDEEEISIMVDKGLLAQVYANLFSNAVKYTEEIIDERQNTRKVMAYGREIIEDCFGPHQRGAKFNVFTTGHHLPPHEVEILFSEGFRGENTGTKPGTGHGLHFIKHVIELHGGKVGYEATRQGNNFYFVIPLPTIKFMRPWPEQLEDDGQS